MIAIVFYLITGAIVLKASGMRLRTFLPSLAFPNAGNLGLPLAFFAAGDEGLNYAIVIFAITSIFNLTIGQALAAGRGNWTAVLKSPIIPRSRSVGIAYGHIPIPLWAANTLSMMSPA